MRLCRWQTDPDGEKYSFKPSEIVPVVVMDMRSKLKTAIRRNSVFMTRFHKSGKDDFCAPQIQSYEVPELLKLYIKVAIPHFRKLMTYQVATASARYIYIACRSWTILFLTTFNNFNTATADDSPRERRRR